MYIERLLKDIGILYDDVQNPWDFYYYRWNLYFYWGKAVIMNWEVFSISELLIKNIDKILSLFYEDRLLQNWETQINEPNNLFKAIQEDKLEEWASSLYNNK